VALLPDEVPFVSSEALVDTVALVVDLSSHISNTTRPMIAFHIRISNTPEINTANPTGGHAAPTHEEAVNIL
jgi:phosphoribulokinase